MPNPAPFPPTAYDTADWIRATTNYTVSGGGTAVPAEAGGIAVANDFGVYTSFGSSTGININIGPNDGKQHSLVSASVQVLLTAGTITGDVFAEVDLIERYGAGRGIIHAFALYTAIPTAGGIPSDKSELSWAGGLPFTPGPNLDNQLTLVLGYGGYEGGTITSGFVQAFATLAWT